MSSVAIALGTFDGLHIGHKAVLNGASGDKKIALTFETPPKSGDNPALLITSNEKNAQLKKMGFEPIVLDFKSIKNLSPLEFLIWVRDEYNPSLISSGFNFKFGKNAIGDSALLDKFCNENNIKYSCADAVIFDNEPVSSTRIRRYVADGQVLKAAWMLNRYFMYETSVVHGDERGRTIGFPTINQNFPMELVVPKFGVYASMVEIGGKLYPAVTDIGVRPTFKTDHVISETHILDFENNVYEKNARVWLVDFLREEKRFENIDQLKSAISKDKITAQNIIKGSLNDRFLKF